MDKCLICGEIYTKRHSWLSHKMKYKDYFDKYLKTKENGICVVCGKPTKWNRTEYRKTCSIQCATFNPERQEKIRNTCMNRYGVPNIYMKEDLRKKSAEAIKAGKRNYKCLNCGKDCGIKRFCSDKCKKIYSENNSYNNREQAIKTCKERFDGKMNSGAWNTRNTNIEKFEKEYNCTSTEKLLRKYGGGWKTLNLPKIMINKQNSAISNEYIQLIKEYSETYHNSIIQQELYDFIKSIYKGEIIQNDRQTIKPQELDIYLPKKKLAIEFNGIRWHSIELDTPKDYHLKKSKLCREKGIRLIHIYEFEDIEEQKQLLKSLIKGKDKYNPNDYNKNNLINKKPRPALIYKDNKYTLYGAGRLY